MHTLNFSEKLKAAGLKRTPTREAILQTLATEHRLFTIDELVRTVNRGKKRHHDWSTVYRCVRKFEEVGLVEAIPFSDGQARYELKDAEGHHHHHVICTKCESTTPIEACSIAKLQDTVADLGFTAITHRLEFFGICADCR